MKRFMSELGVSFIATISVLAYNPVAWAQTETAAAPAASQPAPVPSDAEDRGWPRQFEAQGHVVRVHQPQVEEWPKYDRITFRAAISVGKAESAEPVFGIIRVSADTKVAFEERLVVLTNRKLEGVSFPDVDATEAERLKAIVIAATPPEKPQTISLDRLIAGMDPAKVEVRKVEVNVAPPKIYSSAKPAIIIIFMGKSRFKPVPDSDLLFAINTNWDVFLDSATQQYFLLNDKAWLTTKDLDKGPWTATTTLPPALSKLPSDDNWNDVRAAVPGIATKEVPVVFVSHEPAELVVTQGEPELELIPGTSLAVVSNTENHLFYSTKEREYYLLSAGRWFKAAAVAGPWSAASAALPEDFKKLPADTESDVLASVPGTDEANEAIIMASIPQKATINRSEVKVEVTYDGTPDFRPIETTTVKYAYNSPFNVFLVEGKYYCCHNAVWFVAATPTGVWTVCDSVPKAIYTIPPTSPKYNVTYVTVYESTPTTVVTGYSSGYSGETVAATGVVMFGLGLLVGAALDDDCCWGYHYNPCFYSYGCGAVWHGGCGGYVASSRSYGPYGGAGRVAAYNPSTGVYSRGGYAYGPNGAAGYRTAYNPSTGAAAGRAGGTSPYGSWGRSAVTNGDEWVRAGHTTTSRGTVGAIESSKGGAAVTAQGRYGNGATVAKDSSGDYYAAKDGNVYKKGESGWEQTRNAPSGSRSTTKQAPQQTSSELQRQSEARARGDRNSAKASTTRSSGGQRSAPSRSGGGRGGRK